MKEAGRSVKHEVTVYRLVIRDDRTPRMARVLLGVAVGYALLPFDLIPDFIPVIGHLDDAVIIPLLVVMALWLIPAGVVDDCRQRAASGQPPAGPTDNEEHHCLKRKQ